MVVMAENSSPGELDARRQRGRFTWRRAKRIVLAMIATIVAYHLALIFVYRFIDPPGSNLILLTLVRGGKVDQRWVPMERISKNLVRAVLASEDSRFCKHWGVDWRELQVAIKSNSKRGPRGASTISMQTAKNLFLWPTRSYVRKLFEFPLALTMDLVWPKRRMLEIYLNIAQWGPGIFGAEAAAQRHFKTSAAKLSRRQAALLSASLPNPTARKAYRPGPLTRAQAGRVQKRMRHAVLADCIYRNDK